MLTTREFLKSIILGMLSPLAAWGGKEKAKKQSRIVTYYQASESEDKFEINDNLRYFEIINNTSLDKDYRVIRKIYFRLHLHNGVSEEYIAKCIKHLMPRVMKGFKRESINIKTNLRLMKDSHTEVTVEILDREIVYV